MSKFQFGDMVRDEVLGVCVVLSTSEHFLTIQNANGNFNTIANPDHVEPIPHPDTARLDWLEQQATSNEVLLEHRYPDGFVACGKYPADLLPNKDVREAIDAAVKLSE